VAVGTIVAVGDGSGLGGIVVDGSMGEEVDITVGAAGATQALSASVAAMNQRTRAAGNNFSTVMPR